MNFNRHIWEGWTTQDFIDELYYTVKMIMNGQSITPKFKSLEELKKWLRSNQPYYKKDIPEVIKYFSDMYNLS